MDPTSHARCGSRPAVLCVGQATLDQVYDVEGDLLPGHKHRAAAAHQVGGGVAANAAVTVARLGGRPIMVGRVGTDSVGDAVYRGLRDEGVDTHLMQCDPVHATPMSAVIVGPGGRRTVVNHTPDGLFDARPPALDGVDVDAVLIDGRWPAGSSAGARHALEHSLPCVVDVDRVPSGAAETKMLLEAGTHLVFGEDALADFAGTSRHEEGLRAVAAQADAFVAVTLGERGVAWCERGSSDVHHLPAFAIDAVDTTAAGDVFHGALALALAEGASDVDALRFASAASAIKCGRNGARSGIPHRADVDALLAGEPAADRDDRDPSNRQPSNRQPSRGQECNPANFAGSIV